MAILDGKAKVVSTPAKVKEECRLEKDAITVVTLVIMLENAPKGKANPVENTVKAITQVRKEVNLLSLISTVAVK